MGQMRRSIELISCVQHNFRVGLLFYHLRLSVCYNELCTSTSSDTMALYKFITPPPVGGRGIVFARFLSLFVSLFVLCQQHCEKTAGPICMKFSGKVWSDHGTT